MSRTDLGMSAFERCDLGASNDLPTVIFEDILAILGSLKVQKNLRNRRNFYAAPPSKKLEINIFHKRYVRYTHELMCVGYLRPNRPK